MIKLGILFWSIVTLNVQAEGDIMHQKKVIGATATFTINQKVTFKARIDTGAATTSINTTHIEVENSSPNKKENVGKIIHFTIVNANGSEWVTSSVITKATKIINAQGVEIRYSIPLRLSWNGIDRTVDANLRDRSSMKYKLLIGRDWIAKEVIVDLEFKDDSE